MLLFNIFFLFPTFHWIKKKNHTELESFTSNLYVWGGYSELNPTFPLSFPATGCSYASSGQWNFSRSVELSERIS